jgi:hypothetical protein
MTVADDDEHEAVSPELEGLLADIDRMDEPALRKAAMSRLSAKDFAQLEAINRKGQSTGLTAAEEAARDKLLLEYEEAMVTRAAALATLKRRNVDVSEFLRAQAHEDVARTT